MSRYILRAECANGGQEVFNALKSPSAASIHNPNQLTVFIGDRALNQPDLSITKCSSGLFATQHFSWLNIDKIQGMSPSKLFLDYTGITVTLSVDLKAHVPSSEDSTPPSGAMAVNLGSKGWQFNSSNMLNGTEWGKLVYYEPGGLGLGWSFDANKYYPRPGNNIPAGLGMYVLGGFLPDVSFELMTSVTNSPYIQPIPIYTPQISRDQSLLTVITSPFRPSNNHGYWSVQPCNHPIKNSVNGRWGGTLEVLGPASAPAFGTYNMFGFVYLGYPTAGQIATTATAGDQDPLGWNLLFPSYMPSTDDGYIMPGNSLAIKATSFFTPQGLQLMQNPSSNPGGSDNAALWTNYWNTATSNIHLEETKPFYIEAPLFHAPVAMNLIPNIENGLDFLVPITRMYNGVYMYVPIKSGGRAAGISAVSMNGTYKSDSDYTAPVLGTLQKWFYPTRVALYIDIPFVRIDSALQASRYFNTAGMSQDYAMDVPVWLKFRYVPQFDDNNSPISSLSVDTTASLTQIAAAMQGGYMTFSFSARQLLNAFGNVLASHNLPVSSTWGTYSLEISGVAVSCTTYPDLPYLYRNLYSLPSFASSVQGSILMNGGMKMYSFNGHSLSEGPPNNMTLYFDGVLGDTVGVMDNENVRSLYVDISPEITTEEGNDFYHYTRNFVFSDRVFLRIPETRESTDSGGSLRIAFSPRAIFNLPYSGEALNDVTTGGVLLKSSTVSNSTLTSSMMAGYKNGWFNNLNPFSPDFNKNYSLNAANPIDEYPFLDYKLVNLARRKVEIWIQLKVPIQIYNGNPFM